MCHKSFCGAIKIMTKHHPIYNSELRNRTRKLVNDYLILKANTYIEISKATGLSPTWIAMFARGELNHTDVGRVEILHDFLSNKSLVEIFKSGM